MFALLYYGFISTLWALQVAVVVKNLLADADKETQVQSLGQKDSLEKDMATHSSILPWRSPWTEEHGEQIVGHN